MAFYKKNLSIFVTKYLKKHQLGPRDVKANRLLTMKKKQFRVEITTKGLFDVEAASIDTEEYNIDEITSDDFDDFIYDSDYICNFALGDEWQGQFKMKVFDENDNMVYENDDISEFLIVTDAEDTEHELFPSTIDPKKAAEEWVKRWKEDGIGEAPGIYAVRRHEIKWLSFEFIVEDEKFYPSKLLFVSNRKIEGLVYDNMTDPYHLFYEDKFVETEVDDDYDEYGSTDLIMEKTEKGWWEVIHEIS